jgi:ribose 1,5-bisphosphokinase
MSQQLIYTMGPSGAGKDSLLAWLRLQLSAQAPVHFARRTIDRPVHADGEQYESIPTTDFHAQAARNAFALHWSANSLHYGIRHTELDGLQRAQWVLVNGSRAYLPTALERHPDMTVLHITASADVLRQRLLSRGRESPEMVEARVQRAAGFQIPDNCRFIEVHNDASLDTAGHQLMSALKKLDRWDAAPR